MSEEYPPSLAAALAKLQTQLPRIAKSETAKVVSQKGSYSYTYAGLADISAQVLPLLGAVGLAFTAKPTYDDNGRYVLLCRLLHVSGEFDEGVYLLPTSGTPQALGSAITYGRRYLLCAMVGVAPEEDDDGAAAEAAAQQQPRTAQRANKPATTTRQAPKRAAAQRPRRPAPAEPPLPGEEPPPPDEPPADEPPPSAQQPPRAATGEDGPITRAQLTKLHTQLGELDITDRADKLTTVALLVQRPEVTSSNQLTKQQANRAIETLERILADEQPSNALDAVLAQAQDSDDTEDGDA